MESGAGADGLPLDEAEGTLNPPEGPAGAGILATEWDAPAGALWGTPLGMDGNDGRP